MLEVIERAINKFFVYNSKSLDELTIGEIQHGISKYYKEETQRDWTLADDLVEKLLYLKRQ